MRVNTLLRTLPELVTATAASMAGWPDPDNGQVRATPDERTLRWYGTIGLLDRPLSWRGRTALYGERHLLQVLAIKRLQLAEWTIAAIQERLIAVDDHDLAAIATASTHLPSPHPIAPTQESAPASVPAASVAPAPSARRRSAFWAAPVAPPTLAVENKQHIDLGHGAVLSLPAGLAVSADLEAALTPLQAWLAHQSGSSSLPPIPHP